MFRSIQAMKSLLFKTKKKATNKLKSSFEKRMLSIYRSKNRDISLWFVRIVIFLNRCFLNYFNSSLITVYFIGNQSRYIIDESTKNLY